MIMKIAKMRIKEKKDKDMKTDALLLSLNNEYERLKKGYDFLLKENIPKNAIESLEQRLLKLGRQINILPKIKEMNLEIGKKYYLASSQELYGVYFSIQYNTYNHTLYGYFYVENDDWLYENFYSSHSELNKMVNNLIVANLSFISEYGNYLKVKLDDIDDVFFIKYMIDLLTTDSWKRERLIEVVQNTFNTLQKHYDDGEEIQ